VEDNWESPVIFVVLVYNYSNATYWNAIFFSFFFKKICAGKIIIYISIC
jgi:hypothetical protein